MFMTMVMLFTWQVTNDNRYQEPFKKTVEAAYAGSELKQNVDVFVDKTKEKINKIGPITKTALSVGPAFYALGVRKTFQLTTTKVTIPGTTATYRYENKMGSVNFTWSF